MQSILSPIHPKCTKNVVKKTIVIYMQLYLACTASSVHLTRISQKKIEACKLD